MKSTVISVPCEDDKLLLASLYDFIDREKQYLGCPAEGPDELRYLVYRTVFCKVFQQTFVLLHLIHILPMNN